MTTKEFNKLIEKNQPHDVFKLDWGTYYPIDFANTFLPKVNSYESKGAKFFDGAELLNGLSSKQDKLLQVTESRNSIDTITLTFLKNVEAGLKKNRVIPANQEVATFIEIDQNEKAKISFKFGNTFKHFIAKQNLSTQTIESKHFETDIKTIQNHFNKTLSQENTIAFVLKTIGIDASNVYGNTQKGKLESLLKENSINSFIYHNKCTKNDYVTIKGTIENGLLLLQYINVSSINLTTQLNLSTKDSFVAFKKEGEWAESPLPISSFYNGGTCPNKENPIREEDINRISELITEHINFTKLKGNEKELTAINKSIEKQLNNPFYNDVKLCVNVTLDNNTKPKITRFNSLDGNSSGTIQNTQKLPTISFPKNDNECDITLDFFIDRNGNISVKHKASPNYLKEYVDKWEKEVKKRGLNINVEELRQQVIKDFEDEKTSKSFTQAFIQKVKASLNTKIGEYIEAVQATQKIAKNVWKEGQINESTWHSNKEGLTEEYKQWPNYVQLEPVIGGATDGVIDEIVGIPMAIKGVYGIATDEKQRKQFVKLFSKEGLVQVLNGLESEAKEIQDDPQKAKHFTGKTTVSVASMMVPGMQITKIGKIGEVIDTAADGLKKVKNPKTLKGVNELKTETKYLPKNKDKIPNFIENRKGSKEFLKNTEIEILDDLGEDIAKVVKKGESAEVLKKARQLLGTSSGQGKVIKGKWLKGKFGNAGLFPKSVADKLKGKEFNSFDDFRQQFWKTVADDPDLASQFRPQNIGRMKDGKAPRVSSTQNLGEQKSYILHHKTPINQGGSVYDMDNLYIITPKFHKEILAPEYHFGYGY